jgi:hypothetical protein
MGTSMLKKGLIVTLIFILLLSGFVEAHIILNLNLPQKNLSLINNYGTNTDISDIEIDYSKIPPGYDPSFILVLPHITPNKNIRGFTEKSFDFEDYLIKKDSDFSNFNWEARHYQITISINNSIYEGTKHSPKEIMTFDKMSLQDNEELYYNSFINDPTQKQMYSDILKETRKYRTFYRFTDDQYLEFIVRFVQSIPYNDKDPTKFPIETIYENNGDCEDKSMLLAGLLARENYDVRLFKFDSVFNNTPGHMVVGVRSNNFTYPGTSYALIDSTAFTYIGQFPKESYKPNPQIIKIGNGAKSYSSSSDTYYIDQKILSCFGEYNYEINKHGASRSEITIKKLDEICRFIKYDCPTVKSTFHWFANNNNPIIILEKDRSNYFLYPQTVFPANT